MYETLVGAAITCLLTLTVAVGKLMFSHDRRISVIETYNRGKEELHAQQSATTKEALTRIELGQSRVESKLDHILIKGVPNAVPKQD